jgi:ABC-type multidrug transport system fused ATPase/permease subunit
LRRGGRGGRQSGFATEKLDAAQAALLRKFHSLEFDRVRFRYTEGGPWVVQGVSFRLDKGAGIALVGGTGSGKSATLRRLTKTYDCYEGSIRCLENQGRTNRVLTACSGQDASTRKNAKSVEDTVEL